MTATDDARAISDEEACRLMLPVAVRHAERYGSKGWDIVDDLIQEGLIGAMAAAKTFDPAAGVKFTTYATPRVSGAMIDYIRDHYDHLSRLHRQKVNAGEMDEPFKVVSLETMGENGSRMSAATGVYERGSLRLDPPHRDPDSADAPVAEFLAFTRRHGVRLCGREARILCWRFVRGLTAGEIARRLGVTESRVFQITRIALDHLREHWTHEHGRSCVVDRLRCSPVPPAPAPPPKKKHGHADLNAVDEVTMMADLGVKVVEWREVERRRTTRGRVVVFVCPHCGGHRAANVATARLWYTTTAGVPDCAGKRLCVSKSRGNHTTEADPCPTSSPTTTPTPTPTESRSA